MHSSEDDDVDASCVTVYASNVSFSSRGLIHQYNVTTYPRIHASPDSRSGRNKPSRTQVLESDSVSRRAGWECAHLHVVLCLWINNAFGNSINDSYRYCDVHTRSKRARAPDREAVKSLSSWYLRFNLCAKVFASVARPSRSFVFVSIKTAFDKMYSVCKKTPPLTQRYSFSKNI